MRAEQARGDIHSSRLEAQQHTKDRSDQKAREGSEDRQARNRHLDVLSLAHRPPDERPDGGQGERTHDHAESRVTDEKGDDVKSDRRGRQIGEEPRSDQRLFVESATL